MAMPTRYSKFLNESLLKQQQKLTQMEVYQGRRYMRRNISSKIFCWLVQIYILWLQIKLFIHMLP